MILDGGKGWRMTLHVPQKKHRKKCLQFQGTSYGNSKGDTMLSINIDNKPSFRQVKQR